MANKTLPVGAASGAAQADNIFIWVDGNDRSAWDTMKGRLDDVDGQFHSKMHSVQEQINRFHKKDRRGKLYWYVWKGESWKYVGPVNGEDPRTGLQKDLEELDNDRKARLELMRSCVIKELGKHLLVDMRLFQEHIGRLPPTNRVIQLSEVLT